jgi:hypothetical protein
MKELELRVEMKLLTPELNEEQLSAYTLNPCFRPIADKLLLTREAQELSRICTVCEPPLLLPTGETGRSISHLRHNLVRDRFRCSIISYSCCINELGVKLPLRSY